MCYLRALLQFVSEFLEHVWFPTVWSRGMQDPAFPPWHKHLIKTKLVSIFRIPQEPLIMSTLMFFRCRWKSDRESFPFRHDKPQPTLAKADSQRPCGPVWVPDPSQLWWALLWIWLQQVLSATWRVLWTLHMWLQWKQDMSGRLVGAWLQHR